MNNLIKWVNKNIPEREIMTRTDGGKMVFVPAEHDGKVRQHLKRTKQNLKTEYRASYTWLAIYE